VKGRLRDSLHSGTWPRRKCEVRSRNVALARSVLTTDFPLRPSHFPLQSWRSHVDLHHEPPPSRGGVQIACTLGAENWLPDPDSHRDRRLNRPPCSFDTIRQETSGGANRPPRYGEADPAFLGRRFRGGNGRIRRALRPQPSRRSSRTTKRALRRLSCGSDNWHAALVLPQAHLALETGLRGWRAACSCSGPGGLPGRHPSG
jgi:hypothetical protein